jgi:hypothetical protein
LTPQGRAIRQASIRFGNGATLPFTPCKRGYIPVVDGHKTMVACSLHDAARRTRLEKNDGGVNFRKGEVDLTYFWNRYFLEKQRPKLLFGEASVGEQKNIENDTGVAE